MKILFKNHQAPGDIVAMTGAIRDLKKQYPFHEIAMDTTAMDIWINNPYLSWFSHDQADIVFTLDYPDVHRSNQSGRHFTQAYYLRLEEFLGLPVRQLSIWPDLHLTDAEKQTPPIDGKYWIVNSGYKSDFPLKSWGHENYQRVVDMLAGQVQFVQVGEDSPGHVHFPLAGAINKIGSTTFRDYMILAYHSCGSLGPVSMHLHVGAAFRKPCVIVAGAREPWRWEAYPNQRYVGMNGLLPCSPAGNGCWKCYLPSQLAEGDSGNGKVCTNLDNGRARCMTMITPEMVVAEIMRYYEGGVL